MNLNGKAGHSLGVKLQYFIMQSHATRVVEEMEKKGKDNEEKGQQPFESSEEWQRMLPEDD